ncbi:MAG: inorganic phosphate transporter [Fibrobacteraceae bacterium]
MDIYVIVIGILFLLAAFDLVNGVSNDASNFLNSAIGSKAFSFKVVIILAALGIFLGASFSSGMMDVARHGIFQPQHFFFEEIIAICVGAMLTDVVLLDVFNTLGLPTSTTVSMVFELLGGSFALSLVKVVRSEGALTFGQLINTEKALSVILAIFLSVALAFIFGLLVQFISRLLFTFEYKKREKYFIALFGGFSLSTIFYFVLFQGLKGSALSLPAVIVENKELLLLGSFFAFAILSEILFLLKVNVLKIIVACGTFSLALSFAGNDLVNFIGVPLAGLSAFVSYSQSGLLPSEAPMTALCSSEKSLWWILSLAGFIMALALAFSKKARKVINTSVSLASQSSSDELFGTSPLARALVRYTDTAGEAFVNIIPVKFRMMVHSRFDSRKIHLEGSGAAFDLLRASVNLMLASILISLGTSLKLPLSTTYVTFMVAMGTSLADKAWGRETAVYRITGVLSVIGGWFLTAFAAFVCSFIVTNAVYFGGIPVMLLLFAFVVFLLVRSTFKFNKKVAEKNTSAERFHEIMDEEDGTKVLSLVRNHYSEEWGWYLVWLEDTLHDMLVALASEDLDGLRFSKQKIDEERKTVKRLRHEGFTCSQKMVSDDALAKRFFLYQANDFANALYYCMDRICEPSLAHVDNHFTPLSDSQKQELLALVPEIRDLIEDAARMVISKDYSGFVALSDREHRLGLKIVETRKTEMQRNSGKNAQASVCLLYLTVLYECRALLDSVIYLTKASKKLMTDLA